MGNMRPDRRRRAQARGGWRATLDTWGGPPVVAGSALVVLLVVAAMTWSELRGGPGARDEIPVGEQIEAFTLPDVVTGQPYEVGSAHGERPIVVVSYMGFF